MGKGARTRTEIKAGPHIQHSGDLQHPSDILLELPAAQVMPWTRLRAFLSDDSHMQN